MIPLVFDPFTFWLLTGTAFITPSEQQSTDAHTVWPKGIAILQEFLEGHSAILLHIVLT